MQSNGQPQDKAGDRLWDPLGALPKARHGLWLALAILVGAMQGPRFIRDLRPLPTEGVDFFQEWSSARNLFEGRPVYGPTEEAVERYLGFRLRAGEQLTIGVNAHPPTSVLLVAPLARLDYPSAVLAWNAISLAALGISLWLVARALNIPLSVWSPLPVVVLLLLCGPFRQQIYQGQLNLVLLLLLTGVWRAERAGRDTLAGTLLGIATAVKLFPGFLFLYFLLGRRWKVVGSGVGSLLIVTGLTAAILGVGTYRDYVRDVLPRVDQFRAGWDNASLVGFWTKLFDPPIAVSPAKSPSAEPSGTDVPVLIDVMPVFPIEPLWRSRLVARAGALICCSAVVALLVWVVRQSRSQPQRDRAFGLSLVAMLLVSPICWEHYFLLLLVPLTLLWVGLSRSAAARGLFLALSVALWLSPDDVWRAVIPVSMVGNRLVWTPAMPWQTVTVLSFQCYALLGLFAFLFRQWRQWRRREEANVPAESPLEAGVKREAFAEACTVRAE
jgi:Glycosyltransferase family 87